MLFYRKTSVARKLVWVAAFGLLAAAPLPAAPSDEEQKELAAADQAYNDGAFDGVDSKITALLKKYPQSELRPAAELLQARALYQLGRDEGALAAFTLPLDQVPTALQADTLFWQGQTLLDAEKWPDAEQKFKALLALKDMAGHEADADLGLAWAVFKQGREAEALPIIQNLAGETKDAAPAQHAQLLLAKIQLAKAQFPQAIATLLALLATSPDTGLTFEANYWLGEASLANNQADQAVAAYRRVTDVASAFPKPLVAAANLGLGRAEHALGQFDLAATAYEKAYQLAENETARLNAFRAFLESAREANQLPEAVETLQEYAKNSNDSAPAALFAIGLVLAEDNQEDKAIGTLESLLVAYPHSAWSAPANDQLGRLYVRAGKSDLARKALQACIDANSDPALVRAARLQLGQLLYAGGDFAGAAAQFTQTAPGTDAAAEEASFNFLLAEARLNKMDTFLKAAADFTKRFPASGYLKKIALTQGLLETAAGKTGEAEVAFEKGLGQDVATPDEKALLRALSDLQYQTGDLAGAYETNQRIIKLFPDDSLEANELAIRIAYEMKKLTDDQAEQALGALTQKYGKSLGGAEAFFKLGEFYSFRQDYVKAQDAFEQLTATYPQSDYVDDAYFFAGQAAFQHGDYATAHALLDKVPDNSPFKPDAHLWEGKAFQEQLNFPQAIAAFDAVLDTEKSGPAFVEASLLKGECLFGQKNYAAALDAYGLVLKGTDGTVAQRNQAAEHSAKCFEMLGKRDEAMDLYLKVLYGRIAGDDAAAPQAPDFSWQVEAGVEAGLMREHDQDFRGAIEIYKRLEQIGGAHQQEFHDLIEKLRRDNYIYE